MLALSATARVTPMLRPGSGLGDRSAPSWRSTRGLRRVVEAKLVRQAIDRVRRTSRVTGTKTLIVLGAAAR